MIAPLDMQIAINAIPEFARQTSAEQAGVIYRQVADLGLAHKENLIKKDSIDKANRAAGLIFQQIEPGKDEIQLLKNKKLFLERRKGRKEMKSDQNVYFPGHNNPFRYAMDQENTGQKFDLVA